MTKTQAVSRTLRVPVSDEEAALIDAAVARGDYGSETEAAREAIAEWLRRLDDRARDLAELKRAYREGMDSGAPRSVDVSRMLSAFRARS